MTRRHPRFAWTALPDDGALPDLIPEDLPDEVMLILVMVAPEAMDPTAADDLPPGMEVGGGLQMRLNCPLPDAIAGVQSALAALQDAMARAVDAHAQRN
jgi:hypothetical protein